MRRFGVRLRGVLRLDGVCQNAVLKLKKKLQKFNNIMILLKYMCV